ncbi:MAG: hypothetical protein FOGNACKC_03348 [Anaerolineae bacterium]|nr:hypothetical protein [Anaerolineae bacterium]
MTTLTSTSNTRIDYAGGRTPRLWEIDALRGVAIILVVFYHFVWDLSYFRLYPVNVLSPSWQIFARSIGSTFIFLLGVSLTLSHLRVSHRTGQAAPFVKYLRRGGQLFGLGLVISVVTYVVIGPGFVVFGILHLLGLGVILAYPFLQINRWVSLVAGLFLIGLGAYLNTVTVSYPWLIWFGIKQQGRAMVDYYPLLPWFGITLLGIFAGRSLYPHDVSRLVLPDYSRVLPVRGLRLLGRHTLFIYLVHQPILIGFLFSLRLILD